MTTQNTPPPRLALIVVGLIAVACIALAVGASVIAGQVREINRDNIEVQRMAIEATREANRVRDAAEARQEMKQAHSDGVNSGAVIALAGAGVGFGLFAAAMYVVLQTANRGNGWG